MNKITFPLNLRMKRQTVADLQDGLQLLLAENVLSIGEGERQAVEAGLKTERAEDRYGKTTRKLVRLFQEQHQLGASGAVDEATANRLNDLLEKLGETRGILGFVRSPVATTFSTYRVEACYYGDEEERLCLPKVTVSQNGAFKVPLTKHRFPGDLPPSFVFRVYHQAKLIRVYSGKNFWNSEKPEKKAILSLQPFDVLDELEIKGRVVDQTDAGVGGLRVAASGGLAEELAAVCEADGNFSMKLHKDMLADAGDEVRLTFAVFKGKREIRTLAGTESWQATEPDKNIKIVINRLDLETVYTVSGTITYANKKAAPDLPVQIFDKDFRADTLLGEVKTDKAGHYSFAYRDSQFHKGVRGNEKKTADLFLRVQSLEDADLVDESEVYFNAGQKAIINLELSRANFPVKTEFEEILQCLRPFLSLKKLDFKDLTEQDLQFFAGETGFKRNILQYFHLGFAIVAGLSQGENQTLSHLSGNRQTQVLLLAQFFYGVLRQKDSKALQNALTSEAQESPSQKALRYILELSESEVRRCIDRAVANFYIQQVIKDLLDRLLELWSLARRLKRLNDPRQDSGVSTDLILKSSGVTDPQAVLAYMDLLMTHGEENVHFFAALSEQKILDADQMELLRFKIPLAQAGYGDRNFVEFLLTKLGVSSAVELAQLSKERIKALLRNEKVVLPQELPGKTTEEKLCALLCLLEYYFPEEYIRQRMRSEDRGLAGTKELDDAERAKLADNLATFLGKNPNFKFTLGLHQQDQRDAEGKRGLNTDDIEGDFDQTVLPYLEKVSRVSHITPRESEMRVLLDDGLHSANKIHLSGQQLFVERYQDQFSYNRAVEIFQTAEVIAQTAVAVYVDQLTMEMGTVTAPRPRLDDDFPAWEKLFGSISTCACADCESVLSPAAYLVSLFEFLDSADCFETGALEQLFKRRPDLPFINLNCENTNTELPYIDIVNELLEEFVDPNADNWQKQTTRPNEELAVMPEHINRKAYPELFEAYHPLKLPFHLELEECRAYLDGLGIDRLSLIKTFLPVITETEVYNRPDWAIEKLAINQKVYETFDENSPLLTSKLWAEPDGPAWWQRLTNLRAFLDKTGLDSREAYTLFDLHTIKNLGGFRIEAKDKGSESYDPDDECDLDQLLIKGDTAEFPPLFRRIHLLLRLQKITGWSFHEVDEYCRNNNETEIDLQEIAQLVELKEQLNLSTYQVLSLFYPFSDQAYTDYSQDRLRDIPSYLQRTFRLLDSNGRILKISFQKPIQQQADLIRSGCGLSAYELDQIIGSRGDSIRADQNLTVKILSYFYRLGVLLRSLGISIDDYFFYHDHFKKDPVTEYNDPDPTLADRGNPANTLEFVRLVRFFKSLKLSTADLSFILTGEKSPTYENIRSEAGINAFFTETDRLVENIYGEEVAVGPLPLDEALLKNELATLLKVGLDEPLVSDLKSLIMEPTTSHFDLVDNHFWFKFTQRDIVLFRNHFVKLLFSVGLEFESDLEQASLSAGFRQAFEDHGISLSDNVSLTTEVDGNKWDINDTDTGRTYTAIKERGETLNIYPPDADQESRYHYTIRQLVYWDKTVDMLTERLAVEFEIDPKSGHRLLQQDFWRNPENSLLYKIIQLRNEDDAMPVAARQYKYRVFRRVSLVIAWLQLSQAVLDFVTASPEDGIEKTFGSLLGCYDLTTCLSDDAYVGTFTELEHLFKLQLLFNTHQTPNLNILDALRDILAHDIKATLPAGVTKSGMRKGFFTSYKTILAWKEADLAYLIGVEGAISKWGKLGFDIALPLPYPDANGPSGQDTRLIIPLLSKLFEIHTFAAAHPFRIEQLHQWVANTDDKLAQAARSSYQVFKSDINDRVWRQAAAEIRNLLREQQRDALVAYLLNEYGLAKPDDLYTRFLLDVEMGSCRNTSRIKSAISSTQLFINRILMNLEPIESLPKAGQKWQWMKQYRIWEAKQKVFFFPENYLVPNLLDSKTPLLKELENDLLKDELNEVNAKEAVITYLEGLGQIARLQICGMYEEIKESGEKILHVFARTWGKPHTYYYRQQDPCGTWTAWAKVDADLEGNQLIPIVYNNRMYVFWPEITQEVDDVGEILMNGLVTGIRQGIQQLMDALSHMVDLVFITVTAGPANIIDAARRVLWTIRDTVPEVPLLSNFRALIDGYQSQLNDLASQTKHTPIWGANDFDPETAFDVEAAFANALEAVYNLIPKKRWNIKLAWCEERQGKWSAKKVSAAFLEYEDVIGALFGGGKSFIFNGRITGNPLKKIEISCSVRSFALNLNANEMVQLETTSIGQFLLENRLSPLKANQNNSKPDDAFELIQQLTGSVIEDIRAETNKLQAFAAGHPVSESDQDGTLVREKMDAVTSLEYRTSFDFSDPMIEPDQPQFWYQLITPHQFSLALAANNRYDYPFFYQDARNSYFVSANNLTPTSLRNSLTEFKHPFVSSFVSIVDSLNLNGFYSLATQSQQNPANTDLALLPENVDFSLDGTYAQYNWELFFHIPFIVADRLRQNQDYEQALKWLHFIFDPTISHNASFATGGTTTSKYWVTKPFFDTNSEAYGAARLRNILGQIDDDSGSSASKELQCLMDKLVETPFNVHLIARHRTTAYQKAVVMLYIDVLIEWGDHLFRQYTIETITEAFGYYYTALTLLGPRPEILPPRSRVDRSYRDKKTAEKRDDNRLEILETLLAGNGRYATKVAQKGKTKAEIFLSSNCLSAKNGGEDADRGTKPDKEQSVEIVRSLSDGYFCLPYNKKLHAYWDTLEDRMHKIRHCLNLEGESKTLALFQPEINPEILVKIAAQGGSISEGSGFLNMPPGHYRFTHVLQRAFELCGELKSLGSALLSAIEKRDGEELSLIRNTHEAKMLDRVYEVKEIQLKEASLALQSLDKQVETSERRKKFYEDNLALPINLNEASQLGLNAASIVLQTMASSTKLAAAAAFLIPEIKGGFVTTLGVSSGGKNIGGATREASEGLSILSGILNSVGSMIGTVGSYERRMQDWTLQKDVLDIEMENLNIQIESATKRLEIAQKELNNQNLQRVQTTEIRNYMEGKFSNTELYHWQIKEISAIFFRTYQLVFDLAQQAEKAYQLEMGLPSSSYVQYGRWDSLRKGLLSGERLFADLKELELAYMQRNTRKPELTKTISLKMLDPTALLTLKLKGCCSFEIPEYIFDLDHPGHFFRKIKSLAISIPCVVGPYTGVHAKLTLVAHETRKNAKMPNDRYQKQDSDDRFIANSIGVNSIATSSAQNDSGMFEFNLRDERYLPFEGAGVISKWKLELPRKFRQFNYNTISDVLLHLNYTARDGGDNFGEDVITSLEESFATLSDFTLTRMFSLQHDFPTEWYKFVTDGGNFEATIKKEYFPYFVHGRDITFKTIKFGEVQNDQLSTIALDALEVVALTDAMQQGNAFKLAYGGLTQDKNAQALLLIEYMHRPG